MLYKHKHLFDIKLICTTAGNCSVETTLNNVKYFAKNYFPEAVVAKGSKNPLVKTNAQNAEDVHGESGLGLVKLTKQTYPHLENSVEAMKDVLIDTKDKYDDMNEILADGHFVLTVSECVTSHE